MSTKLNKEDWFIQNYRYKSAILCAEVAGKVGMLIYNYLKFKKNFDGDGLFYSLPKKNFDFECKVDRQRKCEAVNKLEAAGLIQTQRKKGCSTKIRLLLK
tara:strand:- start:93 stop:392 length:300 start_codon:yes stop_codon:yes gene_type:complete